MNRVRISIAGLMGLVVLAAIGLAALIHPTRMVANGIFSLTLGLGFAAVVAAVASEGRGRSAWIGAAICGWGYLALSLGPWFEGETGPHLITTALIDRSFDLLGPPNGQPVMVLGASSGSAHPPGNWVRTKWDRPQDTFDLNRNASNQGYFDRLAPPVFVPDVPYSFYRIAHSVCGLGAGLAGGLLAWGLARKSGGPASRSDGSDRSTTSTDGHP
jgi:hypothetical protein